jgi:RimJ/RimL family protein N-acetyltransferase
VASTNEHSNRFTNEHGQPIGEPVPGWVARQPPAPVTLVGRYVRLEPVAAAHAEALYAELCGPEDGPLWTYRVGPAPTDLAAMERDVAAMAADADTLTFAVVPAGEERAAGMTTLMRIDPAQGSIEVGSIIYARRLQRTPVTTEATHLLARHVFDDLGYRRFEWKCDSHNEPSRRAAVRLGFTYEGRFRHAMVYQDRNRDTDWFSITDAEWPAVRAAHERWLDPENFDPQGQQLTPLRPHA